MKPQNFSTNKTKIKKVLKIKRRKWRIQKVDGLLSSELLSDLNPRTTFVLLCVCGIPASLAAGTLCTFGASALQVSGRLCSAAFGRGGQAPSTGSLLGQFARILFLLLPLCGAAVGMLYLAGQAKLI